MYVGVGTFSCELWCSDFTEPVPVVALIVSSELIIVEALIQGLKKVDGHRFGFSVVEGERVGRQPIDSKALGIDLAILLSWLMRVGQQMPHGEARTTPELFLQEQETRVREPTGFGASQALLIGEAIRVEVSGLLDQALVAMDLTRGANGGAVVVHDCFKTTVQEPKGTT